VVQFSGSKDFRKQVLDELTGNILPFWITHAQDNKFGGFYGAVHHNLEVDNEVPRFSILCARILWAFSSAYRKLGNEEYLDAARYAYEYLTGIFWDQTYGGVYWSVNKNGQPVSDRKHQYAQTFAIYGLSEYYRATQDIQSLKYAQDIFVLCDQHAYDSKFGGYIEANDQAWQPLEDMRLSDKDINSCKSMNTMLHLLEALTNLRRSWPDDLLYERHKGMLVSFLNHIFDPDNDHLKLFFDEQWNSLSQRISFGHDIEASWLLCEAAELIDDIEVKEQTQNIAVRLAKSVLQQGMNPAGNVIFEGRIKDSFEGSELSWWPQVEGMVGFINAYQITGDVKYADAALRIFEFIQNNFIDREHGGWYKEISLKGTPIDSSYKIGPWEGPYHHTRACLEIIERLSDN
jgi:mannobiose 2-epimerase